jgi:hypothetical protein
MATLMALPRPDLSVADTADVRQELAPGREVERTMIHEDPVIQRALIVLGQEMNPIRVVGPDEIREIYAAIWGAGDASLGLDAFRAPGELSDPNIYVNKDSGVYRRAARELSALTLLKLAATLAHEQVHNTDGEPAAYRVQADFVRSRLQTLRWHQREEAQQHLQTLDARARALARLDRTLARRRAGGRHDAAHIVGCEELGHRHRTGHHADKLILRVPALCD